MSIQKKEVEICKEIDDVLAFIVELINVIKNKGDYTSLIDEVIKAVDGIGEISEEAKNIVALVNTVSPRLYEIVEILIKKEDVAA